MDAFLMAWGELERREVLETVVVPPTFLQALIKELPTIATAGRIALGVVAVASALKGN
jgi:hypothetical protein